MSQYKPYPAYKNSGVEWLGKIPSHWKLSSVKWEFSARLGKMLQPAAISEHDVEVPYHKAVSVQWESVAGTPPEKMWASASDIETYELKNGDLLICEGGDVGRSAIFESEGNEPVIFQNSLHRVRPKNENNPKILLRLMQLTRQSGWFDVLCSKATIVHFTGEKLGSLPFPVAPPLEQSIIDKVIDRETSRIDALIEKKTRFIELLREKRQALITHAVTKGLNPNAKMKDSGVEWLGEVPTTWTVCRLRHVTDGALSYGANESAESDDPNNPRFIRITDLNEDGTLRSETFKSLSPEIAAPYLLDEGDVLLARSGATVGKSFIYQRQMGPACYAGYLIRVKLNKLKILPHYFWLCTRSSYYREFISESNIQSTIQNVSGEKYANFWLAFPTPSEQIKIIEWLGEVCSRIDKLSARTEQSIDLLKERRSALITAAVTGQIDLREAS